MWYKRSGDTPPFLGQGTGVGGGTSPIKRSGDAPPFLGDVSGVVGGVSPIYSGGKAVRGKFHGRVYHILSEIGSGGSGSVFLARCGDRAVALKISRDMIGLIREYRYLKEFSPDGFAPEPYEIDDVVKDGDLKHYISIEYIKGNTLRQILKKGSLTLKNALDIGIKLGGILEKIHRKGLIYCDLKPENVIVCPDGSVKLVDLAGIMREGASIREFTKNYDRGAWNMGPRIADRNYNMFSLACIIIEMLEPQKFKKAAHISGLLSVVRSKYPPGFFNLIDSALKGSIEFDVFYRNLVSLSAQIKDKNPSRSADAILNIVLVCSFLFFIFTILLAAG